MSLGPAKPASARIAAILLFVGLPVILAGLTALNAVQVLADRVVIAGKESQVAALERRLKNPRTEGKRQDLSSIYLDGASRALASANLQQKLVGAISTASGRLIETLSVDPADPSEQTDEIRLKATLDIGNEGLLQLLHGLEAGLPLLDIETLSVRRVEGNLDDGQAETLRVDLMLNAHWRRRPAA